MEDWTKIYRKLLEDEFKIPPSIAEAMRKCLIYTLIDSEELHLKNDVVIEAIESFKVNQGIEDKYVNGYVAGWYGALLKERCDFENS